MRQIKQSKTKQIVMAQKCEGFAKIGLALLYFGCGMTIGSRRRGRFEFGCFRSGERLMLPLPRRV
jgi:hypothetical protein